VAGNPSGCGPPCCSATHANRRAGSSCNTQTEVPLPALIPIQKVIPPSASGLAENSAASPEDILCGAVRQTCPRVRSRSSFETPNKVPRQSPFSQWCLSSSFPSVCFSALFVLLSPCPLC